MYMYVLTSFPLSLYSNSLRYFFPFSERVSEPVLTRSEAREVSTKPEALLCPLPQKYDRERQTERREQSKKKKPGKAQHERMREEQNILPAAFP